ncbi:MAG: anthranilate phosphoribosyltransferase [Oceanococcaceae bacterium]
MTLHSALEALIAGRDLDADTMTTVMTEIMTGAATPAQVAGFLVALRIKGETVVEITAAAQVMRAQSLRVDVPEDLRDQLVDTCGTGGDGAGLFNLSTASALLLAALGVPVAKHGNRSVSSKSGSADVLTAAGLSLENPPEAAAAQLHTQRFSFLFAPMYHPAMKHAIGPRRELKTRTVFNLLGPLTNPAGARRQVLGVFSSAWLEPMAAVLQALGSRHVLVVHGEDGVDELSLTAPTRVCELRDDQLRSYTVTPEDFGLTRCEPSALRVESAEQSLACIREAFGGVAGPVADALSLNAGAGLYVAGRATDLAQGVAQARDALRSGIALTYLDALRTGTPVPGAGA